MGGMQRWILWRRLWLACLLLPEAVMSRTLRLWAIPPNLAEALLEAGEKIMLEEARGGTDNVIYDIRLTHDARDEMIQRAPYN
jgi:hypothetical protein